MNIDDKEFYEWARTHPADVSAIGVITLLDELERLQAENRTIKNRWHLMAVLLADRKLSCYGIKPDLQIYAQILKEMAEIEGKNPLPNIESEG